MPILIPIAIGAAGISLGMTVHGTLKQRKWKKIHDERLNSLQSVQKDAVAVHSELGSAGYSLGQLRIEASETLQEAGEYLKAIPKKYELESIPEIPSDALEEWINLPPLSGPQPRHQRASPRLQAPLSTLPPGSSESRQPALELPAYQGPRPRAPDSRGSEEGR